MACGCYTQAAPLTALAVYPENSTVRAAIAHDLTLAGTLRGGPGSNRSVIPSWLGIVVTSPLVQNRAGLTFVRELAGC